jgi:hypothetical protein
MSNAAPRHVVCSECGKTVRLFAPKTMAGRLFVSRHNTPDGRLCEYGSWSDSHAENTELVEKINRAL